MGRGITYHAHLDGNQLKHLTFPLPPLSEQTAIVRFLDHADRRIRRYIRAKQKLIALLEEQKQAIIHQAVTGQIDVRLNTDTVGGIYLGRPPESEQEEIVDFLLDATERIDSVIASIKCQISLLQKYRTRLIADVVTGKLDVREAAAALPEVDPLGAESTLGDTFDTDTELDSAELDATLEEANA